MAAVTQIRNPGTAGRTYYDRRIAAGMPHRSALRALKRKVSDAIYRRLIEDANAQRHKAVQRPGRAIGERLCLQRGRLSPRATGSSDKPLPDRTSAYDHQRARNSC